LFTHKIDGAEGTEVSITLHSPTSAYQFGAERINSRGSTAILS